jgi:AcrR family transcriptional regulator
MDNDLFILGSDQSGVEMPARSDALQNRADILQAAQRLFAEQGVEQVSMAQIAREAGVGKGTLYRNFRNKAELCLSLLDNQQRLLQEETLEHLRTSPDSPCHLLWWFIRKVAEFTEQNLDLLAEASPENPFRQDLYYDHPAHHWQWVTIRGLLTQAGFVGDMDYMADAIYMMLDARLYRFQRYIRGYSHERIVHGLLNLTGQILPSAD